MTIDISLIRRIQLLAQAAQQLRNTKFAASLNQQRRRSTMTRLKLLSIAALMSAAVTSQVAAQQASQEPGAAAFYQSLGVGSHNYSAPDAFASARNSDLSVVTPPVRHHVRRWSRH
jgi:hypothetical protein